VPAIRTVDLSKQQRQRLEQFLNAGTTEQRLVKRIQIVLAAAEGRSNEEVAQLCGCSLHTARMWRNRWLEQGLEGLRDSPGRGRKRSLTAEQEAEIVAATLRPPPTETHWSARRLGEMLNVSKSTVHRVWARHGLQPHRQETFKYSNDPLLSEKVIDIVGLYLHPPENAVVLAVDEKSQIQALNRTQPLLPMKPGLPERRTHDYRRHGTTTLFAALNIATGRVLGECKKRHRHQEFLRFLHTIEKHYPEGQVHIVLDNYSPHKHPKVKDWVARRPRFHFHFTPTSASWMNQVEIWFAILTGQAVRRASFNSVQALIRKIHQFINGWNEDCHPFQWVKTADEILAKAVR
jgi:transposase